MVTPRKRERHTGPVAATRNQNHSRSQPETLPLTRAANGVIRPETAHSAREIAPLTSLPICLLWCTNAVSRPNGRGISPTLSWPGFLGHSIIESKVIIFL